MSRELQYNDFTISCIASEMQFDSRHHLAQTGRGGGYPTQSSSGVQPVAS